MPYFRPDCVKNARNGTTIAVLFALSEQKYNKKSVYCSELPTLAKNALFIRRERSPKSKFLRNSIIVSIAPTTTVLLFPLTEHKIRFQKRTLCCALQSAKQKRKASAHFQTRIFSARRKAFLILGFYFI